MRDNPVFSPGPGFYGRYRETEYVYARATSTVRDEPNIVLMGSRWVGKTELLLKVHEMLFRAQSAVAPVYYRFKGYGDALDLAEDFIKELIKQVVAFSRRDAGIGRMESSLDRLERLIMDGHSPDVGWLVKRYREARKSGDRVAALRNAMMAPHHLTNHTGLRVYLLLDDIHLAGSVRLYPDGPSVTGELVGALNSGAVSFAASAPPRRLPPGWTTDGRVEALTLGGLDRETSLSMMGELMRGYGLGFDTEVLEFAAVKLGRVPMYMKNLVWAARKSSQGLEDLKDFAGLYAREVTTGGLAFVFSSALTLGTTTELRVARFVARAGSSSIEEIEEAVLPGGGGLAAALDGLSRNGLVASNLGSVTWTGDGPTADFVEYLYRTRIEGATTEEAVSAIVDECLREGYRTRDDSTGASFTDQVLRALRAFDGQEVPEELLRGEYAPAGAGAAGPRPDASRTLELPELTGCFDSRRFERGEAGPPVFIARGFRKGRYDSSGEVVWLVMVKDSASPVNAGDVDNFTRRALSLARNLGSPGVVRVMTSRSGFTGEAMKKAEGLFAVDREGVTALEGILSAPAGPAPGHPAPGPGQEYEVVLPSSERAELVAARAAEEIASAMGFSEDAMGEIKAALVEACINAFEHGGLTGSRVRVKFVSRKGTLEIRVRNPGARFAGKTTTSASGGVSGELPRKRGWGIELMKSLMDDVRFERLGEGTETVLVKHLDGKEDTRDE